MGYGITSSTVLVAAGLSPAVASASVHLAQLGTTAASGLAHHRLGNVEWSVVVCLSPPGVIGAFLGATTLSSIPVAIAKPVAAGLLFAVGCYVMYRFHGDTMRRSHEKDAVSLEVLLLPLGFVGGLIDATGGGGWGPVATSGLLADGRLSPAKVIGTVSVSEFFVTVAAVAGFLTVSGPYVGSEGVRPDLVLTLLIAGLLAAPMAPTFVKCLQPNLLGTFVGAFICLSNSRVLLHTLGVSKDASLACFAALVVVSVAAMANVARKAGMLP
uniref:Membrane transporter protein n=2 Tax=Prymnesium polylepis TaxID=72548 RepID=A0A7S4MUD0_9EUKA|mmetsp:Transcript_36547/g.91315  ORF Transcript_36547/g.91315 Transcript_36547/m.91315 type:complete len:270 (+) Transcript_36547:561-1370(+)